MEAGRKMEENEGKESRGREKSVGGQE